MTRKYKSQSAKLVIIILATIMLLDYSNINGFVKFAKYSTPLLGIYLILVQGKIYTSLSSKYFLDLFKLYIVILLVSLINVLIYDGSFNETYVKEILFILSPLVLVMALSFTSSPINFSKLINTLFYAHIIAFFLIQFSKGKGLEVIYKSFLLISSSISTSILDSESETESTIAFSFMLFCVYYVYKKNKLYSLISALIMILSFKRIVIIATIIGVIVLFLFKYIKPYRNKLTYPLLLLFNLLVPAILLLSNVPYYDNIIFANTGKSLNALTMGRQYIFGSIFSTFGYPSVFGIGMGHTTVFVERLTAGSITNVHSDLLKNIYDFGIFLYIIWIVTLYKNVIKSRLSFSLTICVNIIFISDNTFVYFYFLFLYYFIIFSDLQSQKK